jgi:hypothetical protein
MKDLKVLSMKLKFILRVNIEIKRRFLSFNYKAKHRIEKS